MSPSSAPPRGFTLTEVMIVVVLAGVVMLGLVAFYMVSQSTWMDGSAQAMSQREATGAVELLTREARRSGWAVVSSVGGDTLCQIELYDKPTDPVARFRMWWEPSDSLIHYGGAASDSGPCLSSIAERFEFPPGPADRLVQLVGLRLRTAEGGRMTLSTSIAMQNR